MKKGRASEHMVYDLSEIATATDDRLKELLQVLHERADAREVKRSRDERKRRGASPIARAK